MNLATGLCVHTYNYYTALSLYICNDWYLYTSIKGCLYNYTMVLQSKYILSNFPHVVLLKVKYKRDAYYNCATHAHMDTQTWRTWLAQWSLHAVKKEMRSRWRKCDSQFHKDINLLTYYIANERSWLRRDLSLTLCSVYKLHANFQPAQTYNPQACYVPETTRGCEVVVSL